MLVTRRMLLGGLAIPASPSIGEVFSPAVLNGHGRRISQSELTTTIAQHAVWVEDSGRGKRAVFSDCDLSGLDFNSGQDCLVNLQGADFTGANLTGITGKDVSFVRASLENARLSSSRIERVSFSYASLRRARCDNVIWGWDIASLEQPNRIDPFYLSSFQHTDAGRANFSKAIIRGYFYEARFVAANLTDADLSYSEFGGSGSSVSTFFRSDLTRAKFNFAKISQVRFSRAICVDTDFMNAELGYGVKPPESL